MAKMPLIYLYFIFFLAVHLNAIADNVFPVSYEIAEHHPNGKLIVNSDRNIISSYLIKPKWNEESEVLYTWSGIIRRNTKGISLGNSKLLTVTNYENNLLLVRRELSKIFVMLADTNSDIISVSELFGNFNEVEDYNAEWVGRFNDTTYLLKINRILFKITLSKNNQLTSTLISAKTINVIIKPGQDIKRIIYIESNEANGTVFLSDLNGERIPLARINLSENQFIYDMGNTISVVSSANDNKNSLVYIIDVNGGIINNFWIESNGRTIRIAGKDNKYRICYINYSESNYYFAIDNYEGKNKVGEIRTELPKEILEPVLLEVSGINIFSVFRNCFLQFDQYGKINSMDFLPLGEYFNSSPELKYVENYIILSSLNTSLVLSGSENPFWWFFSYMRESGKIVVPILLILIVLIVLQLYRRQKRLLRAVLSLPSAGAVLVIDKNGRLERANSSGMTLIGISGNLPMKKPLQFYFTKDYAKPVKELLEKSLEMRSTISQKVNVVFNGESKEWYCIIVPLRTTTGFFTGLVFTAIDITEELERKRLSNWAQLAHDMQTNLSTIKLNAEQLGISNPDEDSERKNKILHQVNILMHRVRDVVTVGRTDGIDRQLVNGGDICNEVKAEFDNTLFPFVKIVTIPQSVLVSCDRAKLTRALRNAVENAIRSLEGKEGTITISNWTDTRFAYFSIKDTGKGMDEETSKKMLKPYFTTSKKYGGMGMGTMIMQHVAELHGGKINVISEKGKGSEIVFSFPNYLSKRQ